MRNMVLTLTVLALVATAAPAQNPNWLDKMFRGDTSHDFGTVPRGAQLFHRFEMINIWAVPLQLMSVRTSCGCVTATPSKELLQPREKGFLDITMDARRFTGSKNVSVYIMVGPQFTANTTLHISATSRADVVFNPGEVSFGVVSRGQTPTQTIDVEYAGNLDWRVTEVINNGAPLDISLEELYRRPGQVGYRIKTTLKADAPPGALKQDLVLKTNDPASPMVSMLVEATVRASLTVVPSVLSVRNLKVGELSTQRVVVRGTKPFKITSLEGLGDGIEADLPTTALTVQTIILKFKPAKSGELHRKMQIVTDLDEANSAPLTVEAQVAPKEEKKP
jgi:hypothetical protein